MGKNKPVKESESLSEASEAKNDNGATSSIQNSNASNTCSTPRKDPGGSTPTQARWSSGSWRGKASAVAEVARSNISASASSTADKLLSAGASGDAKNVPPKLRSLTKSEPTTMVTRDDPSEEMKIKIKKTLGEENETANTEKRGDDIEEKKDAIEATGRSWIGWWSKTEIGTEEIEAHGAEYQTSIHKAKAQDGASSKSSNVILGKTTGDSLNESNTSAIRDREESSKANQTHSTELAEATDKLGSNAPQRSSWFSVWGSAPLNADVETPSQKSTLSEPVASNVASDGFSPLIPPSSQPVEVEDGQETSRNSGSWAFWSTTPKTRNANHGRTDSKGEVGELAVAKTRSESNPQPARMKEPENPNSGQLTPAEVEGNTNKTSTGESNPKSKLKQKPTPAYNMADSILKTSIASGADDESISSDDKPSKRKMKKVLPANLLLPDLHETLPFEETATYAQTLWRILSRPTAAPKRHLALTKRPPKVKKAVAIGVHGYFPSPIVQKGPPTGTSLKFANLAASSISQYFESSSSVPDVEKIALEGEGMISSRLDTLWKLLLNFTPSLRAADFIVVACHSQGVPVSIMLLAKLLSFGVLKPDVRIGLCGMAGVNLGPFNTLQSRFLGTGSTNELFDFARHDSKVSSEYRDALRLCLHHGVRVLYVGSIDDQLVSLESSLFETISHPFIYRAVFVDGRIHAASFVTALVGLCVKLRNLGIKDHGLIRELSSPLAGSLYTGEGHSRIYEDPKVYDLAVQFALETVEATGVDNGVEIERFDAPTASSNPYVLPWAMRGVLEEDLVKNDLKDEITELVKLFDDWKPQTKVLKDVKVRLEGLRSKL